MILFCTEKWMEKVTFIPTGTGKRAVVITKAETCNCNLPNIEACAVKIH